MYRCGRASFASIYMRSGYRRTNQGDTESEVIGFRTVHGVIVGGGNAASSYRGRSSIRLDARRNEVKEYRGFRLGCEGCI